MAEDLIVLQKTYDMIQYGYQCLRQYPKSEKHTLAAQTKQAMFGLLEAVIRANKQYYKKKAIQEADIQLAVLRYYVRLGMDLGFLAAKKYEHWAAANAEIGRLIGGWLRSVRE